VNRFRRKTRRKARFLFTYTSGMSRAILTLQIPTDDWSKGRILAVSTDAALIHTFCEAVLALRSEEADTAEDPFGRELARLQLEQLRARFAFALGANGT